MKKQRACNHEEGLPKRAWGITKEKVEEDDQQGMTEQASMDQGTDPCWRLHLGRPWSCES